MRIQNWRDFSYILFGNKKFSHHPFFDVLPLVQSNQNQKGVDKQNPNRVYKCVLGILLIDITPAVLHQTTILP